MKLLAGNTVLADPTALGRKPHPMRSGRIGRQIDDTENRPRSGITHKVNPRAIPVIVEVPPL